MRISREWPSAPAVLAVALASTTALVAAKTVEESGDLRPQYLYGEDIPVTCLERSMYVKFLLQNPPTLPSKQGYSLPLSLKGFMNHANIHAETQANTSKTPAP
jgi:hypothetical protein